MRHVPLTALLLLSLAGPLQAQEDTVRVQTLTFDSITTRRGWFEFPDDTHTYRKVLMHHKLKCDPQTTQDQYNCGEWDYLTYNMVHQHTGLLDSNALQHPWFLVGALAPDPAEVAPAYGWSEYLRWQVSASIASVNNANTAIIGTEQGHDMEIFGTGATPSRAQFLITASELSAAGMNVDPIHQLRIPTAGGAGWTTRATIRMRQTMSTSLSGFEELGLQTVFDDSVSFLTDTLVFNFPTSFSWDGISNLLIDIACTEHGGLMYATLRCDSVADGAAMIETGHDGFVEVDDDFVAADPTPWAAVDDAVTITFRAFGAPQIPVNTSILEAIDADGQRLLNIHLPWSDGRVYWDAGNDGSGYDRIDKATVQANVEGQWNNWAFVKNATTGSMKIYLNGTIWHSGTGKTKPMAGITEVRIGAGANGGVPYPGLIDEVNVFTTELSAPTIAEWHDRKVGPTHPDYGTLIGSYGFDESPYQMQHQAVNAMDADHPAWLMGTVRRDALAATELRHDARTKLLRPVMVFVQGDHVMAIDSTRVTDHRELLPLITLEHFAVGDHAAVPIDTLFGYATGWTYTYDPDGVQINGALHSGTLHYNDTLDYFGEPFPEVVDWEIGRYITPYGIGLSLGTQGFRWTYDVTDYQWLLHDSVELSAGNQQELIDLEFEMIEGTPPRTVVNHQRPWGGLTSRSYADLDNDLALPEVQVQLDPAASQWSLRTRLTGHGHNSNDGQYPHCCEWKDNTHYVDLNGTPLDEWHIWQENDCALNPVYPQGGTWLGSREGWCPGDVVKDHSVELPGLSGGGTAALDYRITPVPANNQGMGGGNYVINMDLFEYGAAAHQLDAEIVEVKRPSNVDYHRRDNPICYDPLLVLRNAGAQDLTSVTFTFGVSGGNPQSWTWTGLLKHMERTEVVLPINSAAFWLGDSANVFTVNITAANGASDQHAANDSYRTSFAMPVVYADNFIVNYKTNNRPQENALTIRDVYGNVVFSRSSHTANTTYSDTMALFAGCYTIEFLDMGNDGLSYWADPSAGSGFFRLRKMNGTFLKTFEAEFGRKIHWPFTIGALVGQEETIAQGTLTAYPNPTNGVVRIGVTGIQGPSVIEVLDASGRSVQVLRMELHGQDQLDLDLSQRSNGLYQVRITGQDNSAQLRIAKQ